MKRKFLPILLVMMFLATGIFAQKQVTTAKVFAKKTEQEQMQGKKVDKPIGNTFSSVKYMVDYSFTETVGTFASISGTGTSLGTGDDGYYSVDLSGTYTFNYDGVDYSVFGMNTNGAMNFGSTYFSSLSNDLTTTSYGPIVALVWDDMNVIGGCYYQVDGSVLTLEWNGIRDYSGSNLVNMQVKLDNSTGSVSIIYDDLSSLDATTDASVGITDGVGGFWSITPGATATVSNTVANNSITAAELNAVPAGTIYTFTPAPPAANDLSVTATSPSDFFPGASVTPMVTVANVGTADQSSYDVSIDYVDASTGTSEHSETLSFTDAITSFSNIDLSMTTWTPTASSYNVTATVTLAGDENTSNDVYTSTMTVLPIVVAPYTQDFEAPTTWTNTTDDDGDWVLTSHIGHGASVDHTTGSGSYMGLDDSDPMGDGDVANLLTPVIDLSAMTAPGAYFYYQNVDDGAVGTDPISELHVDVYDGTTWTNDVLVITEEVNQWTEFGINLMSYGNMVQLRFRGITTSSWKSDPSIDDFEVRELPANDLSVVNITPSWIDAGDTYNPSVVIMNNGVAAQSSYDVTLYTEDGSYSQTVNVSETINADDSYTVTSLQWANVPVGTYTLTAVVTLAGDENPSNDEKSIVFNAVEFENYTEGTIYAFDVFTNNIVNVNTTDASMSDVGASGVSSVYCGDFIDGKLYGIADNVVYGIANNGLAIEMGQINGLSGATGLAWDVAGEEVYVSTATDLYKVDENMNAVEVGTYTPTVTVMIGIAADLDGNLYGIDLATDALYSIDKATAVPTLIGNLGIDINYAQDIGYDRTNGVLYGTLYNNGTSQGELYTIDVATGAATLVGVLGDELTACAIYYEVPTYTVTFTVDDGTDPIAESWLEIDGETYTVTAGTIDLDMEAGTYSYTVTADGFEDYMGTYTVTTAPSQLEEVHMTALYEVTFNVDMTTPITLGNFVPGTDVVYLSGTMVSWAEPGTDPTLEMTDADGDSIYSIALQVTDGDAEYKYFQNAGWSGGEWDGGDNRTFTVAGADTTLNDVWANEYLVTFTVDNGTAPIVGAEITIGGDTYTTTTGGVALVAYVNGTYTATTSYTGYVNDETTFTVADANINVAIHLAPDALNNIFANVSITPNPTNGLVTISANDMYNVQIIDVNGKLLSSVNMTSNNTTIDLTSYEAGLYIVKLSKDGASTSYKVIKK